MVDVVLLGKLDVKSLTPVSDNWKRSQAACDVLTRPRVQADLSVAVFTVLESVRKSTKSREAEGTDALVHLRHPPRHLRVYTRRQQDAVIKEQLNPRSWRCSPFRCLGQSDVTAPRNCLGQHGKSARSRDWKATCLHFTISPQ